MGNKTSTTHPPNHLDVLNDIMELGEKTLNEGDYLALTKNLEYIHRQLESRPTTINSNQLLTRPMFEDDTFENAVFELSREEQIELMRMRYGILIDTLCGRIDRRKRDLETTIENKKRLWGEVKRMRQQGSNGLEVMRIQHKALVQTEKLLKTKIEDLFDELNDAELCFNEF
jgi:hypothetical protein